jgi:hypothetical protein
MDTPSAGHSSAHFMHVSSPVNNLEAQSESMFGEALGYLRTLERSLVRKSRFNNELLYQIAAMSLEKLLVALLATYDLNATHHTPVALIKEVNAIEQLPDSIVATGQLIGRFESICSMSGFGYKIPTDGELREMILGLLEIRDYVSARLQVPAIQG